MDVIQKRPDAELRGPQRLPGGMVEDAVIGEIRRPLRTPEVAARVAKVPRKDRPDQGEADVTASLTQFDTMWTALIPAEQARVVQLLVARVTVGEAGLAVDLRHDTLHYVDAPYLPDTRSTPRRGYRHEMSVEDQERLLDFLLDVSGMVIFSGYPRELLEEGRAPGWVRQRIEPQERNTLDQSRGCASWWLARSGRIVAVSTGETYGTHRRRHRFHGQTR